ncbi:MAG: adenylate/guanylate cyclase domain-containing protein [Nitrospirota bacterium]
MKKHRLLFYIITLISTAVFFSLQFFDPSIIREKVEGRTYDLRLHLKSLFKQPPSAEDIVIIKVDEKSIKEIGRWPWKRDVMARLVNNISKERPRAVGLDIMFSEREGKKTDKALAAAIKKTKNLVLAAAFILPSEAKDVKKQKKLPDFFWDSAFMEVVTVKGIDWKKSAIKPVSVNPPLKEFAENASLGHVNMLADRDGILRWEAMYLNYGDDCYPSFALQVARMALGIEMKDMVLYGGSGIRLGSQFISIDNYGRALINYRDRINSFKAISASDIIKGRAKKGLLKDKIVLIGATALATYDEKASPLFANMPGVEKNATVVENIMQNNFIKKAPHVAEPVVILFTGIFFGFILPRFRAIPGAAIAIGFIIFYTAISAFLLIYANLWINLAYPVSNMFIIFIGITVAKFFFEERKAREIRRIFSNYVSPKIVEELISNPEKLKLGGERKTATILFSDLIGFTTLSEKLPPEEVVAMLNEYFKEMAEIIFRWDGTLDKFVGDEIMVFWGAPVDQPNHTELAIRCALHMSDKLNQMQEKWRSEGKDVMDCGMGINTGEVIIGNIGAEGKKMDYTAIGDHVNLTARVEKLTREYKTRILLAENSVKSLEPLVKSGGFGHFELIELASVKVKGKVQEVKIFGLKSGKHEKSEAP